MTFPSARYSRYITDAYYAALVADFSDWQSDERLIADPLERDAFRSILEREARLLDRMQFEAWLELYSDDCAYWVPSTAAAGDPRTEIAMMFDDRRRMEDRIYRLRSGFAWSQAPASRTSRIVSNVEVFGTPRADRRMVRCNFLVSEFRDGEIRAWAGWSGYRFDGRKISAKQVNLLDCDQNIRNPSIIL